MDKQVFRMPKWEAEQASDPRTNRETTLHIGEEVFELLSNKSFLAGWEKLYDACPWATVFQSQAFVTTWYQVYREKYVPIVIKAEYKDKITGLLTLAVTSSSLENLSTNRNKVSIMPAGEYDAEYHAWLTSSPTDESFIQAALLKVHKKFPSFNIHFRFIPPHTPLRWVRERYWKSRCILQSFSRPLVNMSDPDLSKTFEKTDFREKLKKLKRLGEPVFENITSQDQFSAILNDLTILYDFRQGAMFNSNKFRNEPLKTNLLLALFVKKLIRVSVLKINNQIFACITTIATDNWVHLSPGINTHAPFNAKFYSPGFTHFKLLIQQLFKEGVSVFDLTPGGDYYKERLANSRDQVYELVITNNVLYRIKRELRKQYYKKFTEAGKRPMGIELAVTKKLYLLKARVHQVRKQGLLSMVLEQIRDAVRPPKDKLFFLEKPLPDVGEFAVDRNNLNHLLNFKEGLGMTRWEFLENAMRRLEVGQTCYTFCESEQLLCCAWISDSTRSLRVWVRQDIIDFTKGADLLQGIYCHPKGQNTLARFLGAVTTEVTRDHEERQVYAVSNFKHKTICDALGAIGFVRTDNTSVRKTKYSQSKVWKQLVALFHSTANYCCIDISNEFLLSPAILLLFLIVASHSFTVLSLFVKSLQ